jgi:hypothetical protein
LPAPFGLAEELRQSKKKWVYMELSSAMHILWIIMDPRLRGDDVTIYRLSFPRKRESSSSG